MSSEISRNPKICISHFTGNLIGVDVGTALLTWFGYYVKYKIIQYIPNSQLLYFIFTEDLVEIDMGIPLAHPEQYARRLV